MKKISSLLIGSLALALALTGCKNEEIETPETGPSLKSTDLVEAISDFYQTWEETRTIPETVEVGSTTLELSEFIYAEAAQLVALSEEKTGDVEYKSLKAASNPDRDSYDQEEIAVMNGPADGQKVAEDIVTIASRLMAAAVEKGQIPNQTLVYRGTQALAFSTNRATVTIARAVAAYAEEGKFPEKVSTEYLSASTSLYAFAQQFVGYLDVWQSHIAEKLSADGSHCTANNTAWEMVHYIPIPYDTENDYKNDGQDQYIDKDFYTVTIDGEEYDASQCWEIAIRGLLDICTTEGSDFLSTMDSRNKAFTVGGGKSIYSAPIRKPSDANQWGKYPWYESTNDYPIVMKHNDEAVSEVGVGFILKVGAWHVVRSFIAVGNNNPLGMIGNYQTFGSDESSSLVYDGYEGIICPMREFVIMTRIYKYILDNKITSNVYENIKDVMFDYDMYDQQLPIMTDAKSLSFEATDVEPQTISFTATESWTASAVEDWIHVTPASGDAGDCTVTVTVDEYKEETPRAGSIGIAASSYTKKITVDQKGYVKPAEGTMMDFAKAFSSCLDVWSSTVGTVDADGNHNGATAWTNVHLLPIPASAKTVYLNEGNQYDETLYSPFWTAKVGENEYTANQCFEIAARGLLNMCTKEGEAFMNGMKTRNDAYTLANGVATSASIPSYSSNNQWGAYPWYELDQTVTYNGKDIDNVDINFIIKVATWHVVRGLVQCDANASPLNAIGNYQEFGTAASTLNLDGYAGLISPMRELLIMARIYKYIADNDIKENVYDALKGQQFSFDLYGVALPALEQKTTKVETSAEGESKDATFTARENWTATASEDWISVSPASGEPASPVTITITTAANTGAAREGKVTVTAGSLSIDIAVAQAEYVAPAKASIKDFAQQFVSYLDVWQNTVGNVSADGNHCADKGTEWENVHFIPIPMDTDNGWTNHGSQYDDKYKPYHTITVDGTTYNASQCWEIAIRGLLNLCTSEGEAFLDGMQTRNDAYTLANGGKFSETAISSYSSSNKWGKYPWYEFDNTVKYNGSDIESVDINFILKCGGWHIVRGLIKNTANASPLGMIGNFQEFGTSSSTLNLDGYVGYICPMREFLIVARIYKYLLDNNIDANVYDAIKDVKFDFDLYGAVAAADPALELKTTKVETTADGESKEATFVARESWTATPSADWITVSPTSGDAADAATITITTAANTGAAREGKVTIAAGSESIEIAVAQAEYVAPAQATLKDFAKAFVTYLDVWNSTVGNLSADGTHCADSGTEWENVHFVPIPMDTDNGWKNHGSQYDDKYKPYHTITVGETTYTASQAWEIAIRGLLNLCTSEGEAFLDGMQTRNDAYTLANGVKLSEAAVPSYSAKNKWGKFPWYEYDNTVKYNGSDIDSVDVNFLIKCGGWHIVRGLITNTANASPLGMIGNFQEFGTSSSTLNLDGYVGYICPMREFLIVARIYKYLLDNNIDANVYDAIKDVKFDFDLYNQGK